MTIDTLQIIPTDGLDAYLDQVPGGLEVAFDGLQDAEISTDSFSFYSSVSSVFSSKIEGEDIELDSYIKYKNYGVEFLSDYTRKVDDLYDAYIFARDHALNPDNIAEAHRLLSKNILAIRWQGKFRNQNMHVSTPDGKIEYVAASPYVVKSEMEKLQTDIEILIKAKLSIKEVFYYAACIHLVIVKIHPWNDGNGRTARLIEKWFLAQMLGEKAWFVQSEKMYYHLHNVYYNNLRLLGLEYTELDYKKSLPFLLMLPASLVDIGSSKFLS